MDKRFIRIHQNDNVAVALEDAPAGSHVTVDGKEYTVDGDIPFGHKMALEDRKTGEMVVKYGCPIGHTTTDVPAGSWLHSHNMATNLEGVLDYTYEPVSPRQKCTGILPDTFMGYLRADGRAAIRNEIWIIPTVSCVNTTVNIIAEQARTLYGDKCDGIFAYPHNAGCSQLGDDFDTSQKLLSAIVHHPNAGGVLLVSLGCENNDFDHFLPVLGDYDRSRIKCLITQNVEGDEVEEAFRGRDLRFIRVDASQQFLQKLHGVRDPERKRKIIGEEFIRVFEAEAKKLGQVDFLAQGTIYPDVVESGLGKSAVIKSHHNVGGLPDHVDFKEIIEPLRLLFKDETRALGRELGLPEYLVNRQPFPGPGLAVRIIGEITPEKVAILQEADWIFREEIQKAGLSNQVHQYFAVLTDLHSVGVMGDGRTYDYTLGLRGVTTTDFMTADWARIPYEVLDLVSRRIVNEVRGINRIVYDITSKPPATIEWE